MRVEDQVMILYAVTNKMLADIEVDRIKDFEVQFLDYMRDTHPQVGEKIVEGKKFTDEIKEELTNAINEFKKTFA